MKKQLLYGLICVGLITSSMVSALMSPRRIWECFSKPKEKNCTMSEIAAADAAMAAGGVLLLGALAALGVGAAEIKKAIDERNKAAGAVVVQPAGETAEAKRNRELQQIESNIVTSKLEKERYEKQLENASDEEKASINQIIKRYKEQISALENAKKLVGPSTYQWR